MRAAALQTFKKALYILTISSHLFLGTSANFNNANNTLLFIYSLLQRKNIHYVYVPFATLARRLLERDPSTKE